MGMREDSKLEMLMDGWVGISKFEDRIAWQAWTDWRRSQLKCIQEPDSLTVPTPFPPTTIAAAKEYLAVLKEIRGAVGWKDSRAALPKDVSAWMGG